MSTAALTNATDVFTRRFGWYDFGVSPPRPVQVSTERTNASPSRSFECRMDWASGAASSTATGASYTETGGMPVDADSFGCVEAFLSRWTPDGQQMPSKITVGSIDDLGQRTIISEQTVPSFTPTEVQTMKPGTNGGLVLQKVVGTVVQSCMTWEADCAGWWTATQGGTQPNVGPDEYRCLFAGQSVPLIECGPYRQTFDTRTNSPTITDPAGRPQEWESKPGMNSTSPGTGPTPGQSCMDEWSAAPNPIEWILHPVKCALVWAFVPRTSVVTTTQTALTTKWGQTGVGKLSNAVAGWHFVPPAAGCDGVLVPAGQIWGHGVQDFRVLNACSGSPLQPIAVLSSLVIGIAAVLGTIWSVTRSFGGVVGFTGLGGGRGGE